MKILIPILMVLTVGCASTEFTGAHGTVKHSLSGTGCVLHAEDPSTGEIKTAVIQLGTSDWGTFRFLSYATDVVAAVSPFSTSFRGQNAMQTPSELQACPPEIIRAVFSIEEPQPTIPIPVDVFFEGLRRSLK